VKTVLTISPDEAAEYIKRGGIVAFPTETVYGLGANVFDEDAVAKIFEAKQRPSDNPLIAHIAQVEKITELAIEVPEPARKLIDAFFPGPLTVVLKKRDEVPLVATAALDTIGIRMPGSELAHSFLMASGTPVVAPSANLSGRPSPTTWQAVLEDLDGRIDCILQGDATQIGIESTVVDCTGDEPVILRSGALTIERIRSITPRAHLTETLRDQPRSPGLKHRHYSPSASVRLLTNSDQIVCDNKSAYIGLRSASGPFDLVRICTDPNEYASALYEFFRECDRRGIETIYCEPVTEEGIGVALMDRIRRAAAG